jgi:hypothetical protein
MWWCISTPESYKYILPVAQPVSIICVSPYPHRHNRLLLTKLNGSCGEKQNFTSQMSSSTSICSRNCFLQIHLWLQLSTIWSQICRMCIHSETCIIHAILSCSESGDCNKDKYNTRCALWLLNPKNLYCENVKLHHLLSCAEISAALKASLGLARRSQLLWKSPADLPRGLTSSNIWLFYKSNLVAF